jgi:hypothetical protein
MLGFMYASLDNIYTKRNWDSNEKYFQSANIEKFVDESCDDENIENIISKIEYLLTNIEKFNWDINVFDINDLIWLKYNDIKNSFDLLLFILQDNFQKFKKLCEFFVIQNEQIKCEEEFNLLRCILQRYPKEYIKSDKNTNDCKKLVDKFEAKKKQRQKYK